MKHRKWLVLLSVIIPVIMMIVADLIIMKVYPLHVDASLTISRGDRYYYMITIGAMFSTLLAVIVALFGKDIDKYFESPQLQACLSPANGLDMQSTTEGNHLNVDKYFRNIKVENIGGSQALECELYCEYVKITNNHTFFKENEEITWRGGKGKVYIPAGGHRDYELLEIIKPNDDEQADGGVGAPPAKPTFKVLGYEIPNDFHACEIQANVIIYSPSLTKPYTSHIRIQWNGIWTPNKEQMNVVVTI